MFGYIRVAKPELRVKEYEYYKAVYCTLCKAMGRRYGRLTRLGLSYDFTFLALLELALADTARPVERGRCVCNPCKRCSFVKGDDLFALSAAASVLLMGCKAKDDWRDETGFAKLKAGVLRCLLARPYRKAKADQPAIAQRFEQYLNEQAAVEQLPCPGLDRAADPTASVLADLFGCLARQEDQRRVLIHLGMLLGRYVYLTDCLFDLKRDRRKGAFNPLLAYEDDRAKEVLRPILRAVLYEARTTFELLEVGRCKAILGNIIYAGLEDTLKKEIDL